MRVLLQRVSSSKVVVAGEIVGQIGKGFTLLVGITHSDTKAQADWLANKIAGIRLFEDDAGKMNKSLLDVGGAALVVSQFTLAADTSRGNRPGFSAAAPPSDGQRLYEYFANKLSEIGIQTQTGQFGADMKVGLLNDGPVTIWMDTDG